MPARAHKPATYRQSAHFGSPVLGYSLALALSVLCAALRLSFGTDNPPTAPFLFFYFGVAIAAFAGGIGPGVSVIFAAALFGAFILHVSAGSASWLALALVGGATAYGFARLRALRDRTAAVAEESEKLRFVMERVSDWLFLTDDAGIVRYVNQSACTQLLYTPEELLDRPVADLEAETPGGTLPALVAQSCEHTVAPAEIALKRRDGSRVIAEVSCTAIRTVGSLVVHVAARDITERKQLDQNLREALQWESLGALTGGLAHDFNNLLTAIMGNASLAREMLSANDPAVSLLGAIESAGERCAELIRLMLATSGYRPRNLSTLRVDRMAREAAASRPLPPGIQIDVQAEDCELLSDHATIDTLLIALIVNATESYGASPGAVTVTVSSGCAPQLGEASFREGEFHPGDYLGIVVEDHGCGMSANVVARAFNPFYTTKFTGRGLGLPAVRGIVRAHAGVLWLRTEPGEGTRVEVWLPCSGYHQPV